MGGRGVHQALTPLFYAMVVPLLQWMAMKQQMSSTGYSPTQCCIQIPRQTVTQI